MSLYLKKVAIFFLFLFIFLVLSTHKVEAVSFQLVAPTPPASGFNRGDEIKFTVTLQTESGESLKSTQVGIAYESQYITFVRVEPGNTLTTITSEPSGSSNLIVKGTDANGYSGSGTFAYVVFRITATSSGSTQLCSLYVPQTPTTPPPQPTTPPPQTIPRTGSGDIFIIASIAGFALVSVKLIASFVEKGAHIVHGKK